MKKYDVVADAETEAVEEEAEAADGCSVEVSFPAISCDVAFASNIPSYGDHFMARRTE